MKSLILACVVASAMVFATGQTEAKGHHGHGRHRHHLGHVNGHHGDGFHKHGRGDGRHHAGISFHCNTLSNSCWHQ